ncbi:hypothetical protein Ocin01_05650 [Orchesella cincta]|uniref:Uncharacterized protein n=1 Tax=Orchesella cincta TaxID=48709 RepID=A0A1D2N712_ORCCI|nr:hypothetical protein Ocin01_05650 [Orchesella cincta]
MDPSQTNEQKKSSKAGTTEPSGDQGQGKGQGDGKTKKRRKFSKKDNNPGKIHIRLPPIESYEKEIEFSAEAPSRVVVRLERLMGSDRIRPVDGKFMETFIQRLEQEENFAMERKIRLRKKAEHERHRQLAINGFMEPDAGMEDLYNHPVFRVNRILNRLSKLDNSFSSNPAHKQLPPIQQIDPFENDDTGGYFKEYPAHRMLRDSAARYKDPVEEYEEYESEMEIPVEKSYANVVEPTPSQTAQDSYVEEEDEDEYDEELEEPIIPPTNEEENPQIIDPVDASQAEATAAQMDEISRQIGLEYKDSLATLQKKYGVPQNDKFEDLWKPFRCELVDKVFQDNSDMDDMYEMAMDIFEVYIRQSLCVKEHMAKSHKSYIMSQSHTETGGNNEQQQNEEGQQGEEGEEEVEA